MLTTLLDRMVGISILPESIGVIMKLGSQIGSNTCKIHCCISLSQIHGIPNGRFLSLPGLG